MNMQCGRKPCAWRKPMHTQRKDPGGIQTSCDHTNHHILLLASLSISWKNVLFLALIWTYLTVSCVSNLKLLPTFHILQKIIWAVITGHESEKNKTDELFGLFDNAEVEQSTSDLKIPGSVPAHLYRSVLEQDNEPHVASLA